MKEVMVITFLQQKELRHKDFEQSSQDNRVLRGSLMEPGKLYSYAQHFTLETAGVLTRWVPGVQGGDIILFRNIGDNYLAL